MCRQGEVGISRSDDIEDTRLEVEVLHRQLLLAQLMGLLCRDGGVNITTAFVSGDALAKGAAPDAQLEVLFLCEGPGHLFSRSDGEGELPPCLAHGDGGADVSRMDLHVAPGYVFADAQAGPTGPLPAVDRAVLKSRWQVVHLCFVDLLVNALLHVLEYDGQLQRKKGDNHPRVRDLGILAA
uniref:Uncharacterized protein n=1 Tax=Anolis carolinensis TaxID=28377 RepID=A0A803SUV7_ANOCA